jgi:hypothetical protein
MCQKSWNSVELQAQFLSPHWLHAFSRTQNVGFELLYYLFFLCCSQTFCLVQSKLDCGTTLHRRIRPNSEECTEHLLPRDTAEFLRDYVAIITYVLEVEWIFQHFTTGRSNLMPFPLLMYSAAKLIFLTCLISTADGHLVG